MTLYKSKYRIESARLKNWDYSSAGSYFVTICTKSREHYFGNICDGKMVLSEIGKIANEYWAKIPNHFQFVVLGKLIIMPNHVHGIISIVSPATAGSPVFVGSPVETPKLGVSTDINTDINTNTDKNWKSGNLGVIINQYKRACTINIRKILPDFSWQARFHDHIIRNNDELHRIEKYIIENPVNWLTDDLHSKN
ncbi:MAG: transposase [Ignavibacteriales bacterium]|nr:transposase [Melioribacteraceae bacterium]MCF8316614.1 transposase [Ignavibacteriales bacterium]MCF8438266.1 transposase [Ignavibacteriales bacterium]